MDTNRFNGVGPVTYYFERVFCALQYMAIGAWLYGTRTKHQEELDRLGSGSDAAKQSSARRVIGIDCCLVGCLFVELAMVFLCPTFAWAIWPARALSIWRIVDILQYAINTHVFDPYRRGDKKHRVHSLERMLVLSLMNFGELMVCFGVLYASSAVDLQGATTRLDPYYFSVITQMTIGYGDLSPKCWLKAVTMAQGIASFTFGLMVLSRLIALLPEMVTGSGGGSSSTQAGGTE